MRQALLDHPIYGEVTDLDALRIFMEHHVFAVWDFMSLVTSLQQTVTCTTVPWVQPTYPTQLVRFVNEIKLGEESDALGGRYLSHLELYIEAMVEAGADTTGILATLARARDTGELRTHTEALGPAVAFVMSTADLIRRGPVAVAAAFAYGRETLIPDMFQAVINGHSHGNQFEVYLKRHVEIDGGLHQFHARGLLDALIVDEEDYGIAVGSAQVALAARSFLWDGTLNAIRKRGRA